MTIIKINEKTDKGKSIIHVLEAFKDQKDVLEFLTIDEIEEFEDSFLVKEIDIARKSGYAAEQDIINILSK